MRLPTLMTAILIAACPATAMSARAADIKIPKSLVIELIESRCDNPDPNPRSGSSNNPVLEYHCAVPYEDAQGDEDVMEYDLKLIPLLAEDFNQDGSQDIAIEVESSGPLGGSVFTDSAVEYLLLDPKGRVLGTHEILLYAPFSEHIVDYEVVGKQIRYSAVPNFRSHPEAYEDGELIAPALEFTVNWENGSPISTYYQDNCRLARIKNKRLLDLSEGGTSQVGIDIHDYTQVTTETAQARGLNIEAVLSGCDLSSIVYEIEPQDGKLLPVFSEVLTTLIPISHHSKQLKTLQSLEQRLALKFGEDVMLYDGWQAKVIINRDHNPPSIRISLEQSKS